MKASGLYKMNSHDYDQVYLTWIVNFGWILVCLVGVLVLLRDICSPRDYFCRSAFRQTRQANLEGYSCHAHNNHDPPTI